MRYSAAEKLEIIRLVEQSHLPARRTLEQIGVPRATFYRWYDRYTTSGPDALACPATSGTDRLATRGTDPRWMFLCSAGGGRFPAPTWFCCGVARSLRSSMAAGHRCSRREACLTAASTTPGSGG